MKAWRRKISSKNFLLVCLLCLGFAVGYMLVFSTNSDHVSPVNQDNKLKITNSTEIIQKIIYINCDDEEVTSLKPNETLIGLNYHQLHSMYPDWTIERFDTSVIEMSLRVEALCPQHANHMYIGIKDGYVTVFYGIPGSKQVIKEITAIPITNFTAMDIEELTRGVPVESKEDLLRTLEGLQSR